MGKKTYEVTCVECGFVKRTFEVEDGDESSPELKTDGKCPNCYSIGTLIPFEVDYEYKEATEELEGASVCDHCTKEGCRTCEPAYGNYVYNDSRKAESHPVDSPSHYAGSYPFEVFKARALLLDTWCKDLSPSDIGLLNEELKYRFRAGLKQYDGLTIEESAQRDIAKAMRLRQMREEGW